MFDCTENLCTGTENFETDMYQSDLSRCIYDVWLKCHMWLSQLVKHWLNMPIFGKLHWAYTWYLRQQWHAW